MNGFGVKKKALILIVILLLTGCQQIYQDFQNSIERIETLVEQEKWEEASKELKQMKKTYEGKHQWKDFYIEKADYTLLLEQFGLLQGAVKEKDKKQAKIQLTVIKNLIEDFYYR